MNQNESIFGFQSKTASLVFYQNQMQLLGEQDV